VSILGFGRGIPGHGIFARVGGLIAGVALVQHTRDEERQADRLAVEYTLAAGYDADGAARFFEAMEADFGRELRRGGPQFLQSHPYPANRVRALREDIAARGGVPGGSIARTDEFDAALARARAVLPFYADLDAALGGDDLAKVEAAADRGIAALPQHAAFHFWKALARDAAGDGPAALTSVRRAGELDATNVLIPLVGSVLEFGAGELAAAEAAATRAIAIVPALPAPYIVRGFARKAAGRPAEAHADFDRALALVPDEERAELRARIREQDPSYGA
jgi:predicted Zn-dependent protease